MRTLIVYLCNTKLYGLQLYDLGVIVLHKAHFSALQL